MISRVLALTTVGVHTENPTWVVRWGDLNQHNLELIISGGTEGRPHRPRTTVVGMCGNHDIAGRPLDHHHDDSQHGHLHPGGATVLTGRLRPRLQLPQPLLRPRSRRAFLGDFGKGTMALAVFTPLVAACGGGDDDTAATTGASEDASGAEGDAPAADGSSTTEAAAQDNADAGTDTEAADGELRWAQANLGFVSAYVLARGNSATIVDTGTSGSADAIGESMGALGLTYDDVDHVILTHKHGDHAGSIGEVLSRASSAAVYAGEADLSEIDADSIVPLTGGEDVSGFEILATPGHTAGHVAVIDHTVGLLVAGDAIFTDGDEVIEGPERFFEDIPQSQETIRTLASLSYNVLLPGHGPPLETGADAAVAKLAASL